MRIPLILHASPRMMQEGPWVPLKEGNWKVVPVSCDGMKFVIADSGGHHYPVDKDFHVEASGFFRVEVLEPGSVSFFSVYLQEIENVPTN